MIYKITTSKIIHAHSQGRIQPVSLRGAISVIFHSHVSLRVHSNQRGSIIHSIAVTKNGRQNGLISRMLFSKLYKIMVKNVTFLGFRGGRSPQSYPPLFTATNQVILSSQT